MSYGALKCWGQNGWGGLGRGDREHLGDAPDELGDALPAINMPGAVSDVACGLGNVCVVLDGQTVRCWGRNEGGWLGLGDTDHRGDDPGEMDALSPVPL